jgi:hypothetical protein
MSKPKPDFSMAQLIEELRGKVPTVDDDGARTEEICLALGLGETTVRKMLRQPRECTDLTATAPLTHLSTVLFPPLPPGRCVLREILTRYGLQSPDNGVAFDIAS